MARAGAHPTPRTFFLNEQHELARGEKERAGRTPQYGVIDWTAKGTEISRTLRASRATIDDSSDPTRDRHYFLVAVPVHRVPKVSSDKKKAPDGTFLEETRFGGEHSRVFRRLGIDLIDVDAAGRAAVHTTAEKFERLVATAAGLAKERAQEKARWATLAGFAPIPLYHRVDEGWLDELSRTEPTDFVIELQPVLSRVEVDQVLRAMVEHLSRAAQESVVGVGADFSGRRWFRARARRDAIRGIAEAFYSVQSLHPPFVTPVAGSLHRGVRQRAPDRARTPSVATDLPTVAVVDTGIPTDHVELAPYIRTKYQHPDAPGPYVGDHGSFVASRIVYGDLDFHGGLEERPLGDCRVLDVMVSQDGGPEGAIDDKAVMTALPAIIATSPDVRVFNCSFAEMRSMAAHDEIEQRERLILVRDLDNFIFANDVVVVIAAGNSARGIQPSRPYPNHIDDPDWQLPIWPSGFNSLTCGATADLIHDDAIVTAHGWPSPLTRIGPGIAGAPIPEFGAHGGNLRDDWSFRPGLGVWGCTATGDWEDRAGTSYAAPLLARQVAFAFQHLQRFCPPGGRPFAPMVKAFLTLTAERRKDFPAPVANLADRTIGNGRASATRLRTPLAHSAVMLWQGTIESRADVVRVQLPIPLAWLRQARAPKLRLVCCWDSPVNDAARDIWGVRKVIARLSVAPGNRALLGKRGSHKSYPRIDRLYDLALGALRSQPTGDTWLLELSYEEIAEYYLGGTFPAPQRVAFSAELYDSHEQPTSPQSYLQALPVSLTMDRLSVPSAPVPVPIVLRR